MLVTLDAHRSSAVTAELGVGFLYNIAACDTCAVAMKKRGFVPLLRGVLKPHAKMENLKLLGRLLVPRLKPFWSCV